MFTCRVVGTVWATRKHRALEGKRMLLVAPVDGITGKTVADPMMAIAGKIDAGIGDLVLVIDEGSSTRYILGDDHAPIRTNIVGVVDAVSEGARTARYH